MAKSWESVSYPTLKVETDLLGVFHPPVSINANLIPEEGKPFRVRSNDGIIVYLEGVGMSQATLNAGTVLFTLSREFYPYREYRVVGISTKGAEDTALPICITEIGEVINTERIFSNETASVDGILYFRLR